MRLGNNEEWKGSSCCVLTGAGSVLNGYSFHALTGVGSLFYEITS
jgi:hypothetical protein